MTSWEARYPSLRPTQRAPVLSPKSLRSQDPLLAARGPPSPLTLRVRLFARLPLNRGRRGVSSTRRPEPSARLEIETFCVHVYVERLSTASDLFSACQGSQEQYFIDHQLDLQLSTSRARSNADVQTESRMGRGGSSTQYFSEAEAIIRIVASSHNASVHIARISLSSSTDSGQRNLSQNGVM